jgi:hypothetical protein
LSYIESQAEAVLRGDETYIDQFAANLIVPLSNNFVERPWGGMRIRAFKGFCALPDQIEVTGSGLGEAFEIAACDKDAEARRHPSRVRLADGSSLSLPEVLDAHAAAILGHDFVRSYGACFPLLPKTLDIKELLSVQGHPPGNVEVYVIVHADQGATIRLGFSRDVDPVEFKARLKAGLQLQKELLVLLGEGCDQNVLQQHLSRWFAAEEAPVTAVRDAVPVGDSAWTAAAGLLDELKALYWDVLNRMNALPVKAGQVIYNATPARIVKETGRALAAEVHALGNPGRQEILALEIRRPGPTFRAWDNVRFPLREVDVDAALAALNLVRTSGDEFVVEPMPVEGRPGTYCSVDCEYFRVEHLHPAGALSVHVPGQAAHGLHVIAGSVRVLGADGRDLGTLARGTSAIVPPAVGAYTVSTVDAAHVVKVSLPEGI